MISFERACKIAEDYYKQNYSNIQLLKALDGDDCWYFCGGKPGVVRVGNTVISVEKSNGEIGVVNYPSKESFAKLRKATPVDLP